jgi:hypothetical protein
LAEFGGGENDDDDYYYYDNNNINVCSFPLMSFLWRSFKERVLKRCSKKCSGIINLATLWISCIFKESSMCDRKYIRSA